MKRPPADLRRPFAYENNGLLLSKYIVPDLISKEDFLTRQEIWASLENGQSLAAYLISSGAIEEGQLLRILAEVSAAPIVQIDSLSQSNEALPEAALLREWGWMPCYSATFGNCVAGGPSLSPNLFPAIGRAAENWTYVLVSPLRQQERPRPEIAHGTDDGGLEALLETLHHKDAFDIHFESNEAGVAVRARFTNRVQGVTVLDHLTGSRYIARLKALAGLKPGGMGEPQDARLTCHFAGKAIPFRIACLSTVDGESITLRRHATVTQLPALKELGLTQSVLAQVRGALLEEPGFNLFVGATASGKTTSLYSILAEEARYGRKVMTIEDPVELALPGILQSEVDVAVGWTFAAACRAFLRQDPDVIGMGEIRDAETARMTLRAALTGHRVYATLHARSAEAAISRLHHWGIPQGMLQDSLGYILFHRLEPTAENPKQRMFECKSFAQALHGPIESAF